MAENEFHVLDYLVFSFTLLISLGIGIFYAMAGQRTTSEFLTGGRSMTYLPTAISLLVSFESSIMMLGMPAEAYGYGLQYTVWIVGVMIGHLLSVNICVPLFYPLESTSAYEYLEHRFKSKRVRLLGTTLGMLNTIWYLGIVLFGPAVAMQAVGGVPLWSSITSITVVAVIYTSIGGIKAVIWTDVFQGLVMFTGLFTVLIAGTIVSGGATQVWNIAGDGGRLNFFDFSPDITKRHTFWGLLINSVIRGFGMSFNQSTIQRISSQRSYSDAIKMILLMSPAFCVTIFVACYSGVVAYAYFQTVGCDPLESGQISNPNQIMPFIVMEIFNNAPGVPGLFLAAVFSAVLSTLSSGLSSLSALLWADVVQPRIGKISETKATLITKLSVVGFGLLACIISMLVSTIGGPLTQISGTLLVVFTGPLLGVFFLGCFFPRCNATGSIVGGLFGLLVGGWLSLGMGFSTALKPSERLPPATTDQCELFNDALLEGTYTTASFVLNTTSAILDSGPTVEQEGPQGIDLIYTLSYLYIGPIGFFSTIIVGHIVSYITGMNEPGDVDPRYILSLTDSFLFFLPKDTRSYLSSIGPQFMDPSFKAMYPGPSDETDIYNYEAKYPDQNESKDQLKTTKTKEKVEIVGYKAINTISNGVHGSANTNETSGIYPQYDVDTPSVNPSIEITSL